MPRPVLAGARARASALIAIALVLTASANAIAPPPPATCASSYLPGYQCQASLSTFNWLTGVPGLALHWNYNSVNASLLAIFIGPTDGKPPGPFSMAPWVSIAFPSIPGEMAPADAIIAGVSSDGSSGLAVKAYRINGMDQNTLAADATQAFSNATLTRTGTSNITLAFTRPWSNGGKVTLAPFAGPVALNWAMGYDGRLDWHGPEQRGAVSLNFVTGAVAAIESPDASKVLAARRAHGALMLLAWAVLIPCAVFWAWGGKHVENDLWFKIHQGLNIAGLGVALIAFIVALAVFEGSYPHGGLGWAVMIFAGLQPINAIFRRTKGSGKWRTVWEYLHAWWGRLVLLLSVIQMALGVALFARLQPGKNGAVAFGVPLAILLAGSYVLLPVLLYSHGRRHRTASGADGGYHREDLNGGDGGTALSSSGFAGAETPAASRAAPYQASNM